MTRPTNYYENMAKYNQYSINAYDSEGYALLEDKRVTAISLESAWGHAIEEAFKVKDKGSGSGPESIQVHRINSPSESHG